MRESPKSNVVVFLNNFAGETPARTDLCQVRSGTVVVSFRAAAEERTAPPDYAAFADRIDALVSGF